MFSQFNRRPIAQQLIMAMVVALIFIFSVLALVVQNKADSAAIAVARAYLANEAKLMASTLDAAFESVRARGEDQSKFFERFAGGVPTRGDTLVRTGDVDLPAMRIGGELLNGSDRILKSFKELTGDEGAFMVIQEGKLYRVSTLLKNKEGKTMYGVPVKDGDPVATAILAGKDYFGLSIRSGQYYFSTVRALRDASGTVWGAHSVRISLDAELKRIREQFGKVVAGQTGYAFIVRPLPDKGVGEFVMHPKFQDQAVGDLELPASARQMIEELLASKQGSRNYFLKDANGLEREKLIFAETSSAWGWTVFTGSWLDEYLEESHALRDLVIVMSILSGVVMALVVYVLIRSRLGALSQLAGEVERLSQGDLTATVQDADPHSRNEVHAIAHAFNRMAEGMRHLVKGVAETSSKLTGAAGELQVAASAALESSSQASQSASGIAASVEELSVSISQVADNANQAARISEDAKGVTENGRDVVGRAMNELERVAVDISDSAQLIDSLGDRSKQISSVVGVIREIAEQTNLLALNAAIEAARAGEQGRGFAVVADEVRKLAERTSLSTQEISTTVGAILDETSHAVARMKAVSAKMAGSVELAREAGDSLSTIDQHSHDTVSVVHGIADGTREQSAASQEIARLVENIAQAAEGSNSRAQRNSERAHLLQDLAAELQRQLSRFRT